MGSSRGSSTGRKPSPRTRSTTVSSSSSSCPRSRPRWRCSRSRRAGSASVTTRGVRHGLKQAHVALAVLRRGGGAGAVLLGAARWRGTSPTSPVTIAYLVPALRVVPLGALLATPFFLCRPVFEGMGQGRPGLTMAVLRYVVLAAPAAAAWGFGWRPLIHVSPVLGLVFGLMAGDRDRLAGVSRLDQTSPDGAASGTQPPAAA